MVCAWNSSWGNKGVSMKNSVEVKNISFSYGKTEILNDLSLDIKEGEFMVLLGPSGCGKTTLLNCIAGLLDLTEVKFGLKMIMLLGKSQKIDT